MRIRTHRLNSCQVFGLSAFAAITCVWLATAPYATAQNAVNSAPGRMQGPPPSARRNGQKAILIWADTRNGLAQHDSVSHAMSVIERLGYESGAYFAYLRTDSNIVSKHPKMTDGKPASGGPSLANVDAIFFLGHREIELDADQKADLLAFVHDEAKGFVAAHTALTAFESWPEFGELLGGRFDGHPWGNVQGPVINEEPTFPAIKHFPAIFTIKDEFYKPKDFSRDKIDVLLRLDTSKLQTSRPMAGDNNGDVPLAWAKTYGKGRVFYSSFAHDASTWDRPDIQKMYFEAIKWALGMTGGEVKPHPMRNPEASPEVR
jgi:type 1 glutamine amidotransferase